MSERTLPAGSEAPGALQAPGVAASGLPVLAEGAAPGAPGGRRGRLRWLERSLFLVAALCLGGYVWAAADARLFQAFEEWRLERRLAGSATAGAAGTLPPAETAAGPARPVPPGPIAPGESLGRLEVPRLGLEVIVAAGVDNKTLRRAAGHIPGTALPGETGNVGIAGHRDSFFRPLKDIAAGDQVVLTTPYGTFLYEVESTRIVGPRQVDVLDPTPEPALTLVTCYPFYYVGSAPKRFIVRAREIAFEARGGTVGTSPGGSPGGASDAAPSGP
jgi:sortase A